MILQNTMFDMPDTTEAAKPQTTLGGIQTVAPGNFDQLAKSMQVNTGGLHSNKDLARLQLSQRLQKQFGPDYAANPGIQSLMSAFDAKKNQSTAFDKMDMNQSAAQSDRTLGELLK